MTDKQRDRDTETEIPRDIETEIQIYHETEIQRHRDKELSIGYRLYLFNMYISFYLQKRIKCI